MKEVWDYLGEQERQAEALYAPAISAHIYDIFGRVESWLIGAALIALCVYALPNQIRRFLWWK